MNAVKRPYELLVRWDQDGKLRGAHVQWATVVSDDSGELISCCPGNVEPVAVTDGQQGFPLDDILSQAQADALTALTSEQKKSAALEDQLSAANSQIAALKIKLDALADAQPATSVN